MALDTRSRILSSALALLNEEGAHSVSATDLANAAGLSAGNLYYHFRGKTAVIEALLAGHEAELALILQGAPERLDTLEDHFVFALILAEEVGDMRFFYRELPALAQGSARLAAGAVRIRKALTRTARALLAAQAGRGALELEAAAIRPVARQMVRALLAWPFAHALQPLRFGLADAAHDTVAPALARAPRPDRALSALEALRDGAKARAGSL